MSIWRVLVVAMAVLGMAMGAPRQSVLARDFMSNTASGFQSPSSANGMGQASGVSGAVSGASGAMSGTMSGTMSGAGATSQGATTGGLRAGGNTFGGGYGDLTSLLPFLGEDLFEMPDIFDMDADEMFLFNQYRTQGGYHPGLDMGDFEDLYYSSLFF